MRKLERLSRRTSANQPVDVKCAKQEDEGVDPAEDRERNRRLPRRQKWRHGIRGSQYAKDNPRLTAHFGGEPTGNDGNEGERKAEERQPKHEAIIRQAMLVTQIAAEPGEPQHHQPASHHEPEGEEWDDNRWPIRRGNTVKPCFRRGETVGIDQAAERWR